MFSFGPMNPSGCAYRFDVAVYHIEIVHVLDPLAHIKGLKSVSWFGGVVDFLTSLTLALTDRS
jgi:hypothetical protein